MKKIIILSVVFTFILVGAIYATHEQPDKVETVTAEQTYMNHFPDPMPDVVLQSTTGFSLF